MTAPPFSILLPSLAEVTRFVLRVAGLALAVWIVYAAGQSSMAKLALRATDDAVYCAALLNRVVPTTEGALVETVAARAWQDEAEEYADFFARRKVVAEAKP